MSSALEPSEHVPRQEGKIPSPPAFLDLADSSARLGSSMSELSARVELKRMEHERQRAIHRQAFEQHMMALQEKQAQELLSVEGVMQHVAVSAPTTPPRIAAQLVTESLFLPRAPSDEGAGTISKNENRKSVSYSSTITYSPEHPSEPLKHNAIARPPGAKSMPGSRRPSMGSQDSEEINSLVDGLSIHDKAPGPPKPSSNRVGDKRLTVEAGRGYGDSMIASHLSAGHMLDQQLDREMQNAMLHLPISDDDKPVLGRLDSYSKLSTSSAALDLAPLSQTPPRASALGRGIENGIKSSEWPQFADILPRIDRRVTTNPTMGIVRTHSGLGTLASGAVSASATPNIPQQMSDLTRDPSPPSAPDPRAMSSSRIAARSVPATPLGVLTGVRADAQAMSNSPVTPLLTAGANQPAMTGHFNITSSLDKTNSSADVASALSRLGGGYDTPLTFTSIHSSGEDSLQMGNVEGLYGLNGTDSRFGGYPFDSTSRTPSSTMLYPQHQSVRYGGFMGPGRISSQDSKMNGLHGPKHKRGDADREFNRFSGTRLEDLQGEIASLCKDQHGCRYLQKKLEEGVPEHRDMIFRETYTHLADLMTDPFGNYLCQKLLEFSTDEQRTVICDSVAKDLVNISLNMHGTRAVQKMIDFLSVQRQTDARFDGQIHSIILALSRHVVVLIKDLNGNHVIQKCLNKLTPEDNQFIYNAVAANCVEVATHRHGCCVLQRCIDHASDAQRVQLVNEITFNALTLVQDPYGNYVVQYILDLNDNRFSDAVIRQFAGNVCALSVQKFSSNVIEKCIRVAEHGTRKILVDEMLHRSRLEKLLRDSYGNYCVQTALDYADPNQRVLLVDGIRPILPLIRNTPYGKRIQSKLQREQLEGTQNPFGGYSQQQGLSASGTSSGYGGNQAGGHRSQHSLRHSAHMNDMYTGSPVYTGGHPQPQHQSPSYHAISRVHHGGMLDPYSLSNGGAHSANISFSNGMFASPQVQNSSQALFGNGAGIGHSDPYSRTTYPY